MWPVKRSCPDVAVLVLAKQVVACLVHDGKPVIGSVCSEPISELPDSRDQALAQTLSLIQSHMLAQIGHEALPARSRVIVGLSDVWVSALSVPWFGEPDAALLRQQWLKKGYLLLEDSVLVSAYPAYKQPVFSISYSGLLLNQLSRLATAWGGELTSVRVLSDLAWTHLQKAGVKSQVIAILEEGVTTLALGGVAVEEVTVRLSPVSRSCAFDRYHQLFHIWRREALRDPVRAEFKRKHFVSIDRSHRESMPPIADAEWDDGAKKIVVAGQALQEIPFGLHLLIQGSRGAASSLDAVQLRRPIPAALWAFGGLLVLATCLMVNIGYQSKLATAELDRNVSQANPTAHTQSADLSEDHRKRLLAANSVIATLNLPVDAILDGLQPPKDISVGILNLDWKAGASGSTPLMILAEADVPHDMVRYIDFLSSRSIYKSVLLKSHERVTAADRQTYRFTLEIQWLH